MPLSESRLRLVRGQFDQETRRCRSAWRARRENTCPTLVFDSFSQVMLLDRYHMTEFAPERCDPKGRARCAKACLSACTSFQGRMRGSDQQVMLTRGLME